MKIESIPKDNKNQEEMKIPVAIPPAIALRINPLAIQSNSTNGIFFNLKQ